MRHTAGVTAPPELLKELAGRLETEQDFAALVAALRAGHSATLDGVRGSSCALATATLARSAAGPVLVVCPHLLDVDEFAADVALFTDAPCARFPAWETAPSDDCPADEIWGDRLRLLKQLWRGCPPAILVSSIQALLQPVPPAPVLAAHTRRLAVGDMLVLDELCGWLVQQGFHNTPAVTLPGEFSRRGGIVDLFPWDWELPVRMELFGDQIESLRAFDPGTQRSQHVLQEIDLTAIAPGQPMRGQFIDYLPEGTWVVLAELLHIEEEGRHYLERAAATQQHHGLRGTLERLYRHPSVAASALAPASLEAVCRLKTESVERFSGELQRVREELEGMAQGDEVVVVCQTEAEAHRLAELFASSNLARQGRLHLPVGSLRAGFRLASQRVLVLSSRELFQRADVARQSRRWLGRTIDSFLDLREGNYVVHVSHGIARYRGLRLLEDKGQVTEHLELEFAEGTRLYVPATRIELVQKYVGGTRARPRLAKLGGQTWQRQKRAAQQAVLDLASEMLELAAARACRPGIAFPPDSDWQREFDAAFPYVETPDQAAGIEAIKRDMQAPQPMDRLICGDVGYGKTELAMRAAFKAVEAGYQVAVLVPTTILAEQHGRTFRGRMAEYPFEIGVLSRFCSAAEERRIVAGLAAGQIDIVIGTHRLAQPDIRFHNLGLLIIDEEQRFGVAVKERLKAYRQMVDVLTMTATPIPRTLHMALTGLRDISNLETPPPDRLAVETRVARYDPELIRHAVLRELNRGGQVYFVHNRVQDVQTVAARLAQIVPEARLGVGHGQMRESELEQVMLDFIERRFDILLATTIIESGLDIPNANTMFINEADRFGLADLHQLRGRVGRYKHRAYCYLLVDPDKALSPAAARRLAAIEEFSQLGAGFSIAMRDLEIRGAGNILGTQQSGHIAAVGYELYCDLLEKAVRRLKHLPQREQIEVAIDLPGEAWLPRHYVPDIRLKIDLYRRLCRAVALEELAELRRELIDRFGPLPPAATRLLDRMELRILAARWKIDAIHLEDAYLVFKYRDAARIQELARLHGKRLRMVDGRSAYLPLPQEVTDPDSLAALVKVVLLADQVLPYNPPPMAGAAKPWA